MPKVSSARASSDKVALYASVGAELTHYDVEVESGALVRREVVMLPANVQYAWPHASGHYLYVASSDGGPDAGGANHWASALRIEAASGALRSHGGPVALRSRPIHITTDIPAAHALISYPAQGERRSDRQNRAGEPGRVPDRGRWRARLCAQARRRCRRQYDVLDGHGEGVE